MNASTLPVYENAVAGIAIPRHILNCTTGRAQQNTPSVTDDVYDDSILSSNVDDCDATLSETEGGEPKPRHGKKTRGRVKIKMQFISNKLRRYTTFSKRKTGIMKKAYELSTLTGTQVMLLVASETGHVYTFATKKLQPMITSESGKALIQTCLNTPDSGLITSREIENDRRMNPNGFEETDLNYAVPDDGDDGDGSNEVSFTFNQLTDSSILDSSMTRDQGATVLLPQDIMLTNGSNNTFSLSQIIPPTSNSDGSMGKATTLTMQLPPSTISLQGSGNNLVMTSSGDTRSVMNVAAQIEDQQLQIQRQREQIQRLEQKRAEHEQQLQNIQLQHRQIPFRTKDNQIQMQVSKHSQKSGVSVVSSASGQHITVIPKSSTPSAILQGSGAENQQLLYQTTSSGQTLVYAPGATGTLDLLPLMNLVNAQTVSGFGSASSTSPGSSPQFITIPVSLTSNAVFHPVSAGQMDNGKRT